MKKIDGNEHLFSHTGFPFDSKYTCFLILIFFLKEKYHRKIIMKPAKAILSWTICYMGQALSSSPENEMIIQCDFECLLSGRMLNSVAWEAHAVHLLCSGPSVFTI